MSCLYLLAFWQVWPDEGDVNMVALARTLMDAGYPYMLMPVPTDYRSRSHFSLQ